MILRLLNPQGIAGLAASLCLAVLLVLQKGETRRWTRQSAQFEALYRNEQTRFAATVANYRAATEQARAADQANAARVAAAQHAINERTSNDFEARLASARAAAERLRREGEGRTDSRGRGGPAMPGLPAASGRPPQAAGDDGLHDSLIATEQAIQLDELIKWVRAQARVDPNSPD